MARKKGTPAVETPTGKPNPKAEFDAWFKTCTDAQKKVIFEVDAKLNVIQTDKNNLRKEMQPLRVGMELSRVKEIIIGRSGKADPQKEEGRIWGAYRDSHLKDAGYSKSSCDTYVGMIVEARKILPSDELITALIDHTDEQGSVMMTGGNLERPFGKFTMYLRSDAVQEHVNDGKVNLDDLTVDDLIANVFDPKNVESRKTKPNLTVAVNTAVRQIFSKLKAERKASKKPMTDEAATMKARNRLVQYVVEALLAVCDMQPMAFKPLTAKTVKAHKLLTLASLVQAANAKKQKAAKPAKKAARKTKKAKSTHAREYEQQPEQQAEPTEIRPEGGKYVIRKNSKPQFPQLAWEIFEDGKDEQVARCQDKLQAVEAVNGLLKKAGAAVDSPNPDAAAAAQDKVIRKHLEANKPPLAAG